MRYSIKDKLKELAEKEGGEMLGYISVKTPIKVLNIQYDCDRNDLYFAIDQAIVHLYALDRNFNRPYVSKILGLDTKTISERISEIEMNGYIKLIDQDKPGEYRITDQGRNKYFNNDRSLNEKQTVTGSLMVDGTTLDLFPQEYYDTDHPITYYSSDRKYSDYTSMPILQDDVTLNELARKIEKKIKPCESSMGLGVGVENIKIISIEEKSLNDIIILFIREKNNRMNRILTLRGNKTNVPSLNEKKDKFAFQITDKGLSHNFGNALGNVENAQVYQIDKKQVINILKMRYGLDNNKATWSKSISNITYPEPLELTYEMLPDIQGNQKFELFLSDVKSKRAELSYDWSIYRDTHGLLLSLDVKSDSRLESLCKLNDKITRWLRSNNTRTISKANYINDILDGKESAHWRSDLITLRKNSLLEKIDITEYFKY